MELKELARSHSLVFIRRLRISAGLWLLVALLVAGCAAAPDAVESRPDLPKCAQNQEIFLPIFQGPDELQSQSSEALDCFLSSLDGGDSAELEFILLGAEGEEYRSVLQTFEDGTVDFFRENDWGWELNEDCSEFSLPEPGIPSVSSCDSTEIDGPG